MQNIPRKLWEEILKECKEGHYDVPVTNDELYCFLDETAEINETDFDECRWWIETERVVKIGDVLVRYHDARTTGDCSPDDVGWEFDPSTVEVVKEVERTVVIKEYVPEETDD